MEGIRTATVTYRDIRKSFQVRMYSVTELVRELRTVGFREVEAFGGFDGAPVTPESRLVLRAVK